MYFINRLYYFFLLFFFVAMYPLMASLYDNDLGIAFSVRSLACLMLKTSFS